MNDNVKSSPDYLIRRLRWEADNRGLPPFDGWGWLHDAAEAIESLRAQLAESRRTVARWDELHRVIAKELNCDAETWPLHRNAPLAIAARFVILKNQIERAEVERDALLSACKRAWALCYDDRGAMNILAAAIDAARGRP